MPVNGGEHSAGIVAAKTGQSKRTVQRSTRRSKKMKEAVLEKAIGTSIDKGEQLDPLAKLSEDDQEAIVEPAAAGEKVNVTQVAKKARRAEREQAGDRKQHHR